MQDEVIKEDLQFILNSDLPWEYFRNKTILISGANGFLPAYMVETLLSLNEKRFKDKVKVIGIVRNKEKALKRFSKYKNRGDFQLIIQDICNPVLIGERIDYIIHAASQASPKYYGNDPVGTLLPNVLGTYNLLMLAKEKKVKSFLFFSSGEVYGEVDKNQIPTKEDYYGYINPTSVRACYAESKRMGETMCVSWFQQYSVPVKIVRPFHTYGPGMSLDDGRVYADFVSDIVHNRNIHMKSDGSAVRAFCYIADATLGFFAVLLEGENGEAYNVGNDMGEINILNLAKLLVNLFPEKQLSIVKNIHAQQEGYIKSTITRNVPDITKIRKLGWEPKYSIQEGFKRTVRSFTCEENYINQK